MKTLLLLSLAASLCLVGCGDSSNKSETPATNAPTPGGSALTAPVDYLNSAAKAKQSADKTVDTAALNKAIELFNIQEGRFPRDLEELVSKKYIPLIPTPPFGTKIDYDAKAGTVKVVKQ